MAKVGNFNIEFAIEYYYAKILLTTEDIKKIFGLRSDTSARRKKNAVADWMRKNNYILYDNFSVDTKLAYDFWGIDIADLEARYSALIKFRTKKQKMNEVIK